MRIVLGRALLTLLVVITTVSLHPQNQSAPAPDTYVVQKDVMVAMRDGVKLATDLYFPAQNRKRPEGKFPAVLVRMPYGKQGESEETPLYASHGYVFVAQDTRGRFGSEGVWHMMTIRRMVLIPLAGSSSSPGAMAALRLWERRIWEEPNMR